ncbi:BQ5605_C022g09566 [Microbotryum silenes-dioicae]|uniref:BQ5605_C022g09566 protein n=1 Tax=Microbotryum silenes-dioicae TaxID=796604 RepID=A0A2X0PLF1_9BASI|nr:BQ5605_C022g09566 [Microbotryum silenes-dioicae]
MRPDPEYHSIHGNPTRPRPDRRPTRSPPPSARELSIPSLDYYLWQCTQDTGKQPMEGCVALRLWCTDEPELFQQTTADGLPDLTSFARSPGDTIDETDDNLNTNEGVDLT